MAPETGKLTQDKKKAHATAAVALNGAGEAKNRKRVADSCVSASETMKPYWDKKSKLAGAQFGYWQHKKALLPPSKLS